MAHSCLVTGGAGFIGSHLVEALLARGHLVRVLDNFSTGSPANLRQVRDRIDLIVGDLVDLDTVRLACRDVTWVFHQGALASVPRSVADPLATHQVCATGTLHVLLASRDAGVHRVVYAASSSAYGGSAKLPTSETDPTRPLSPYAAAKLAGEQYCAVFTQVYGLETIRLRYFNVFGPRQAPNSLYAAVIPLFLTAMVEGRSPRIYGDGGQSRDFTYVDDAVQANLLAAAAPQAGGKVYNIARGRSTTLLELVAKINRLLGADIPPTHEVPRPGDVRHSQADVSAAAAELGYHPLVDLDEGLRRCLAYCRSRSTVH